jgi:hypothetical protein
MPFAAQKTERCPQAFPIRRHRLQNFGFGFVRQIASLQVLS